MTQSTAAASRLEEETLGIIRNERALVSAKLCECESAVREAEKAERQLPAQRIALDKMEAKIHSAQRFRRRGPLYGVLVGLILAGSQAIGWLGERHGIELLETLSSLFGLVIPLGAPLGFLYWLDYRKKVPGKLFDLSGSISYDEAEKKVSEVQGQIAKDEAMAKNLTSRERERDKCLQESRALEELETARQELIRAERLKGWEEQSLRLLKDIEAATTTAEERARVAHLVSRKDWPLIDIIEPHPYPEM